MHILLLAKLLQLMESTLIEMKKEIEDDLEFSTN